MKNVVQMRMSIFTQFKSGNASHFSLQKLWISTDFPFSAEKSQSLTNKDESLKKNEAIKSCPESFPVEEQKLHDMYVEVRPKVCKEENRKVRKNPSK